MDSYLRHRSPGAAQPRKSWILDHPVDAMLDNLEIFQ
jgi:hypothetical protein